MANPARATGKPASNEQGNTDQQYAQKHRVPSISQPAEIRFMLEKRRRESSSSFVFAGRNQRSLQPSSLAHPHAQVRSKLPTTCFCQISIPRGALVCDGGHAVLCMYFRLVNSCSKMLYWKSHSASLPKGSCAMQDKITTVLCWICSYPVRLEECKTDDLGRPCHENCYTAAVTASLKEAPKSKTARVS